MNIDEGTVQILISKLIDSNVITVKKTKEGQKSFFFLTKYTMAIPAKDNAVSINLNDTHMDGRTCALRKQKKAKNLFFF